MPNPSGNPGVITSSDLTFITNEQGEHLGEGKQPQIRKSDLDTLPIRDISIDGQGPFVGRVDRILTAKQRDAEADTSALEREIDELVYALHGLTPEEIRIVGGAAK